MAALLCCKRIIAGPGHRSRGRPRLGSEGLTLRGGICGGWFASRDRIVGEHGGALEVAVKAPPEGGRANGVVIAEALGLARSRVTLSSGPASRSKTFLVSDLASSEVLSRLSAAAPGTAFVVGE
ncbi:MAG: DUF167 domain-containing protein [Planctomycetes bacterium]|nr:DUF167 domain-containing protein [Planctomycetota bacterium]